jgi:hypothetical protein
MRRVLFVCVMVAGGIAAAPGFASGASSAAACGHAVDKLRDDIAALIPASAASEHGSTAAVELQHKVAAEIGAAAAKHPTCRTDITRLATEVGARSSPPHGTAFLGPIGWLWNEIYYTIFQGNTVLMVMFGWELFVSPFVLMLCAIAVFRGTAGLLRKPYVPPELRTNER